MNKNKDALPVIKEIDIINLEKNKSVKDACVQQMHPISQTQLLTYKEVAEKLKVSERTVRRLVDDNSISCVYIRNSPRIRETDLMEYLNQQLDQCYNSKRMVLDVRKKSKGNRTCKSQRRKKAYTNDKIQSSGGSVTSMNPAKELAALLGQ